MSVRLQLTAMLFLMIQAMLFGAGTVIVLTTGLADYGISAMVAVTLISTAVSVPLAWRLAVYLRTHNRGYRIAG